VVAKPHIVVAGAGIAGLTTALTLAARDIRVTIAEKSEQLSEVGAGVQIAPNAGRVLADIGLSAALERAALEPPAIEIRGGQTGRLRLSIDTAVFRERYGFPYYVIHRADLQKLLVLAVSRHELIDLQTGTTVTDRLDRTDHVMMRLASEAGSTVVTADALIGADGVWSQVRESVAPQTAAQSTGRTAWRALIPVDVAADHVTTDAVGLWLGPDAHLVHYPVAQGSAVNVVATIEERWDHRDWSAAGDADGLIRRFTAWPAPVKGLIEACYAWRKHPLHVVDPSGPWTHDRLALIGDAAHAMTPFLAQGAALAIEDAAVLGHHLAGAGNVPAALAAYEAARKPRAIRLSKASETAGGIYSMSGGMALARDAVMALGGANMVMRRNDWIYRWRAP